MKQNKIVAVNEIYSALLSANVGSHANKLKDDCVGFLAENYGVDVSNVDVAVVENNESQIHLSLPFYAGLEEASAKAMADGDVNVAGGFEFWIAAIVATAISVPAVAATVGAAAGIGVTASK